jgi:hypothetical protein
VKDDGGFALLGMRDIDIHRAYLDAEVAALAFIRKYYGPAGSRHVR